MTKTEKWSDGRITEQSLETRSLSIESWRVLRSLFPDDAPADKVMLAVDYCMARDLDPMKKPIHLVKYGSKWQLIPSILELRITAARTGQYAGRDAAEFVENETGSPVSCRVTVYKIIAGTRCAFVGPVVYFDEAKTPNSPQWKKRPHGMLEKTAEAAALRAAFPEEIGDAGIISLTGEPDGIADTEPSALAEISAAAAKHSDAANEAARETLIEHGDIEPETENNDGDESPLF